MYKANGIIYEFWQAISALALNFILFIVIFAAFYILSQIARKSLRIRLRGRIKEDIATFVSDFLFYALLIIGITVGLSTAGVNMTAIVASLGLGGFALGFALRDAISNFISSLLIILTHTYEVGDEIKVNNFEGRVRSINLRHTVVAPLDKEKSDGSEKILIPNSLVFTAITVVRKAKTAVAQKENQQ